VKEELKVKEDIKVKKEEKVEEVFMENQAEMDIKG
jgi:hypothetical protein